MENKNYKTGIFSGRFDPPHIGHLFTILKLASIYGKIVVVILDYPERETCSAERARQLFDKLFHIIFPEISFSKIDIIVNSIHFGKITFSEYDLLLRNIGACYNHTVYLSGNDEVLKHMNNEQIPYERVERSEEEIYTGTIIRKEMKNKEKSLEQICGEK
jgi:hypothetical protein